MEFKVGSLLNLISGKSDAKGSSSQPTQQKIVYQQKPKVALVKQVKAKKEKKAPNDKRSLKEQNNHRSPKSQKDVAKKSNSGFQSRFKRVGLNTSFRNVRTQGSKPEVAENTSETVVGKSFKYRDSESSFREDAIDGPEDLEKTKRTIFVGNLPLTHKSEKDISKLFSKFGKIESFRLRSIPLKDLRVPKKVAGIKGEFHPDRTNTNAYVVMDSVAAADAALALNGALVDDHHLRVDRAVPDANDPRKAIFVGNVSFKSEEDDLWNLFEQCGEIESVRILRDRTTSVAKGAAYVNFRNADSVEFALKMDGIAEIRGRPVKIHRCLPGRQKSLANSRQSGPRNTDEAGNDKEKKLKTIEEKRFQKKMKRREKREAENAKNEALGRRSRPLKDSAASDSPAKTFVGVKAEAQQQKRKKKRINKGEVQRKKVAKILANPKSETRNEEAPKVADMDVQPQSTNSSESVAPATKGPKKSKAPAISHNKVAPASKKIKKKLSKVMKKAAPKKIIVEEKGELKKKKLKKLKSKV